MSYNNNNNKLLYAAALMAAATMCTAWSTAAAEKFHVQGRVYCDPCRVQFETRLSRYMAGAKVRLQCKNRDKPGEPVTITIEEITNKDGVYRIPVDGDHENEICDVHVIKSSDDGCKEIMDNGMEKSRVELTKNVGMNSGVRFANSLGFMKGKPDPACPDVLEEISFLPEDAGA